VQHDDGRTQVVRFGDVMWDWQEDFIYKIHLHNRVIILKARQLGITWMVCMYALWTAMTRPNATILVMSISQREAIGIIDRIKFIYDNLPETLKAANPITSPDSRTEKGFLNGSHIIALPSTEKSSRSYTSTLTILDEFAFHDYADKNWAAVMAATEQGKIVVISTSNGINNLFYRLYWDAKEKKNDFLPIFLPYYLHPNRDEGWHEEQKRRLTPQLMAQEYPATEMEAFVHSGNTFFDLDVLQQYTPKDWIPTENITYMLRRTPPYLWSSLKVFNLPIVGHAYSIGVDPTNAVSKRADNAAIVVIDAVTGEQVVEFAGQVSIDDLAPLICDLNDFYKGIVVIERNGVGGELNKRLNTMGVPLWWGQYLSVIGTKAAARESRLENAIGLHVNKYVKEVMFERLSVAINNQQVKIYSAELINELANLEFASSGLPQARKGAHDDRAMALAYAWLGVLYLRETGQAVKVHSFPDLFNIEWYTQQAALSVPPLISRSRLIL